MEMFYFQAWYYIYIYIYAHNNWKSVLDCSGECPLIVHIADCILEKIVSNRLLVGHLFKITQG